MNQTNETISLPNSGEYVAKLLVGPLKGPYMRKHKMKKTTRVDKKELHEKVVSAGLKHKIGGEAGGKFKVVTAKVTTSTEFNIDASLKCLSEINTSEEVTEEIEETFEIPNGETRSYYQIVFRGPGVYIDTGILTNDPVPKGVGMVDMEVEIAKAVEPRYTVEVEFDHWEDFFGTTTGGKIHVWVTTFGKYKNEKVWVDGKELDSDGVFEYQEIAKELKLKIGKGGEKEKDCFVTNNVADVNKALRFTKYEDKFGTIIKNSYGYSWN